ncbi:MAG: hypothetical protein JO317_06465 [Verrucomicrobiae bacterium]|nr:hypothetical protein [Verrucomicrobiae bacterium]
MAERFLTLLDMTKRNDSDPAIGLIEEVNTVSPELEELMGRPIDGTTYKAKKRIALPSGPAFRAINDGVPVISSQYDESISQCYFLDGQMQVDEALVEEGESDGNSREDILADEGIGAIRQKLIHVGDSFYRGTTADTKGFVGLQSLYDTANCEVDAAGSSGGARTSAWLVWNDIQGLHFIFGKNRGVELKNWQLQQVPVFNNAGARTGVQMAWVNNLSGWLGLGFGHTRSIVRIKNLTKAKPLTDALVAEAISKLPIFMRRSPNLRLFGNSNAELWLRQSRSTVSTAKTDSGILQFAPPVTESNNVKFVLTDSILNNE